MPDVGASRTAAADTASPLQGRLTSLFMVVVAGFVLWLAVPRFAAGGAIAAHGDTLAGLNGEVNGALAAARERALKSYQRGYAWHDNPQIAAGLGALRFAAAQRAAAIGDPAAAQALIAQSALDHRAALADAPLQPYVWTRLVQADLAGASTEADAVRHLRMAIDTGPWEPELVAVRLGLAFALWDALDAPTKERVEQQIRYAAKFYPASLARQSRRYRAQNEVLQVLESDADLLRRFSLAYSRI